VSDEQAGTHHDPPEDSAAAEVIGCFTTLDISGTPRLALSIGVISAVCGMTESATSGVLHDLYRSGVLTSDRPNWYRLSEIRGVARLAPDDTTMQARRARLMAYLSQAVIAVAESLGFHEGGLNQRPPQLVPESAVEWLTSHRDVLLAAITVCTSVGPRGQAIRLAALAWLVTSRILVLRADAHWRTELARRGEEAAIEGRDPHALGGLLEHSAHLADELREYDVGEAQYVRALAVWRRLNDHEGVVRVLIALLELYRSWGRLHRALDASFELVSEYQRRGDDRGLASALTEVGRTMLAADRPDAAVGYLTRANIMWEAEIPGATTERAHTLMELGRAQWRLGAWGPARRRFSDALALWVDEDEVAADGVRRLMSYPDGQPLPDDD
jgi:tetratricopeptide (TPR) repeat protein